MLTNAFVDRKAEPTEEALSKALGPARALWDRLLAKLSADRSIDKQEWSSYSPKAGWALKLKRGERTILYLSPCEHSFRASFALGDKAVKAALASGLPADVVKIIRQAKRYAEGTAVRIEVKTAKDLDAVTKVAAVKLAK